MIIQRIEKSGDGIEVVVDNVAYFVDISKITTKEQLKTEIEKLIAIPDTFNYAKLNLLKELEGTEVSKTPK